MALKHHDGLHSFLDIVTSTQLSLLLHFVLDIVLEYFIAFFFDRVEGEGNDESDDFEGGPKGVFHYCGSEGFEDGQLQDSYSVVHQDVFFFVFFKEQQLGPIDLQFDALFEQVDEGFWQVFYEYVDDDDCVDGPVEVGDVDGLYAFDFEDDVDGYEEVEGSIFFLDEDAIGESVVVWWHIE